MGTTFYRPASPVTSVAVEESGIHSRVRIWINHALVGTLTLRKEEVEDFLWVLKGAEVAHRHFGGADVGIIIDVLDNINAAEILISDDGEVMIAGNLMREIGRGKTK